MKTIADPALVSLIAGVLTLLMFATAAGRILRLRFADGSAAATVENINARINAWWAMVLLFAAATMTGGFGSILLFAITSFLALREFVTIAPTRPGDHRALFWCFFVVTPLQYALIWSGNYELFSIFVPVCVAVFIAIRTALSGDTERFLERTATSQWGVMICVYFVSYVPALMTLRIPGYEGQNAKLLFFLVLVVQLSDVLQYVWGKSIGRRPVAPSVSPNKTWEGFLGGVASAAAVGAALWWATPFSPAVAAAMSLVITLTGFAGGLIMSAIKRGRGVKDYGTLIPGHGGVLDRIDSLCFAAPVFFHLTRYFYAG